MKIELEIEVVELKQEPQCSSPFLTQIARSLHVGTGDLTLSGLYLSFIGSKGETLSHPLCFSLSPVVAV